jgi:hypothetical protein
MFGSGRAARAIGFIAVMCASPLVRLPASSYDQPDKSVSRPFDSGEQQISVLVLDGKSGKPIKKIWTALSGLGDRNRRTQTQNVRTDSHGVAYMFLRDPIPERVGLSFSMFEFASCSDVEFRSELILQDGVIAKNTCAAPNVYSTYYPTPGRLVVFGRRITTWENIRREIP